VEMDEMLSEANEIFVKASISYDPSRAGFSTHLWWQLESKLNSFGQNEIKRKTREFASQSLAVDYNTKCYIDPSFSRVEFFDFSDTLDELDKKIIDTALTSKEKRLTQNSIRKELRAEGIPGCQIEASFKRIKEVVR